MDHLALNMVALHQLYQLLIDGILGAFMMGLDSLF